MLALTAAASLCWTRLWSEEHARIYFFDANSGEAVWQLPAEATASAPSPQPPSSSEGWADCTEDTAAIFGGTGLQRAWRRASIRSHPDKGGSSEAFQAASAARDYLKSPLRYFAFRALHDDRPLHPLGSWRNDTAPPLVRRASASVGEDADGWPRVTVEISLQPPANTDVGRSHVWRIALAHANASTIEYKGDEAMGGYDVCCHFVAGSRCRMRPRDDVLAILNGSATAHLRPSTASVGVDAGGEATPAAGAEAPTPLAERAWFENRDVHLLAHDCPLPTDALLHASVAKPLHLKAAGRWSAVLLLVDGGGGGGADAAPAPTACVSLVLDVAFAPKPPRTPPPEPNASAPVGFEQLSHGRWCRDGGDLLEGKLDAYTDCDEGSRLCQLTRKCRARCSKRAACRFYTTYASGLCQLSSRCDEEARASDASARTFRKRAAQ